MVMPLAWALADMGAAVTRAAIAAAAANEVVMIFDMALSIHRGWSMAGRMRQAT